VGGKRSLLFLEPFAVFDCSSLPLRCACGPLPLIRPRAAIGSSNTRRLFPPTRYKSRLNPAPPAFFSSPPYPYPHHPCSPPALPPLIPAPGDGGGPKTRRPPSFPPRSIRLCCPCSGPGPLCCPTPHRAAASAHFSSPPLPANPRRGCGVDEIRLDEASAFYRPPGPIPRPSEFHQRPRPAPAATHLHPDWPSSTL